MIQYLLAHDDSDLLGIINLQIANLPANISEEDYSTQGFVTLRNDLDVLRQMNESYSHVIAKDGDKVIGYTLVTTVAFAEKIPLMRSTLDHLVNIPFEGRSLSSYRFFIMGQVCVAKEYRGKGIFASLYNELKTEMKADFEFIITEIATHNTRSMRAHHNVGFVPVYKHVDNDVEWTIVMLDLRK